MKKYIIKSESEEGTYYLCNGWNKHKTYWVEPIHWDKALFNTAAQAKASLTKLLKVMGDFYAGDTFTLCEFENGKITALTA